MHEPEDGRAIVSQAIEGMGDCGAGELIEVCYLFHDIYRIIMEEMWLIFIRKMSDCIISE